MDVGGESTRPGAEPVSADEELRRVLPVLEGMLAEGIGVTGRTHAGARVAEVGVGSAQASEAPGGTGARTRVSIDTTKPAVAAAALDAGATHRQRRHRLRADPSSPGSSPTAAATAA